MKLLLFIFLIISLSSNFGLTQDIPFSEFYNNPIELNPAFAGQNYDRLRIGYNSRRHHYNSNPKFVARNLSADWYARKLHGGLALQLTNNVTENYFVVANAINLTYSYHQKLSKKYTLLLGFQAGWQYNWKNWNKQTFAGLTSPIGVLIEPIEPIGSINKNGWITTSFFNLNSGIAIVSEHLFAGFTLKHINRPNYSFLKTPDKLPIMTTVHAGAKFNLNNKFSLSPNALLTNQDQFQSLIVGLNMQYKIFTLGVWTRNSDAIIIGIGIERPNFKIQYSYDHGISELSNSGLRAHESSIMFYF
ncbi:MAG: PorP/SprF family type IX secretion system membrane protein [Crocinitomicaceae bacterium]